MKRTEAYRIGSFLILRNHAAGRRNRYDTYRLNADHSSMRRYGCELTLAHSMKIAAPDRGRKE